MADLRRELGRKAFHMLSLVYLAAYHLIGFPAALVPFTIWLAVVAVGEAVRLAWEPFNSWLTWFFRGIIREAERRAVSGIFYITAGAWGAILIAGRHPRVVTAALLALALGDAAAALGGKVFGRHLIRGGPKTWEGSLACFLVCLGANLAAGLAALPAAGAALAATLTELIPTSRIFNDNLWMPVAAAAAALSLGA